MNKLERTLIKYKFRYVAIQTYKDYYALGLIDDTNYIYCIIARFAPNDWFIIMEAEESETAEEADIVWCDTNGLYKLIYETAKN